MIYTYEFKGTTAYRDGLFYPRVIVTCNGEFFEQREYEVGFESIIECISWIPLFVAEECAYYRRLCERLGV